MPTTTTTQQPVSILDSPLWVRGDSGDAAIPAAFVKGFHAFLGWDRFGGPFLTNTGLTLDQWLFAFADPQALPVASPIAKAVPPPPLPEDVPPEHADAVRGPFPYLCALPFTVTREMCNSDADSDDESGAGSDLFMCTAAITLITDMMTSFHAFLALHPNQNAHVSVSLQTNQCQPLRLGQRYIAVSRIDKLGRRAIFTAVDYIQRDLAPGAAAAVSAAGLLADGGTIGDLRAVLPYCTVMANTKHVKSILSAAAQQRMKKGGGMNEKEAEAAATATTK